MPLIASPADMHGLGMLSSRRVLFRTCRNKHDSQHAFRNPSGVVATDQVKGWRQRELHVEEGNKAMTALGIHSRRYAETHPIHLRHSLATRWRPSALATRSFTLPSWRRAQSSPAMVFCLEIGTPPSLQDAHDPRRVTGDSPDDAFLISDGESDSDDPNDGPIRSLTFFPSVKSRGG